jgi:hypothetical protein
MATMITISCGVIAWRHCRNYRTFSRVAFSVL